MKQVAVIEFNGDWDMDTIHECLGMMTQFNFGPNQGMGVVTLTEEGKERVLEAIVPSVKEADL